MSGSPRIATPQYVAATFDPVSRWISRFADFATISLGAGHSPSPLGVGRVCVHPRAMIRTTRAVVVVHMGSRLIQITLSAAMLVAGSWGCEVEITAKSKPTGQRVDPPDLVMDTTLAKSEWLLSFRRLGAQPQDVRVRVGSDAELRPLRRPVLALPQSTTAAEITVYYTIDGEERGPQAFEFDPEAALRTHEALVLTQAKDYLDLRHGEWAIWDHHEGQYIIRDYTLEPYKCSLKSVEYGFAGEAVLQWKMPCHGSDGPAERTLTPPADATAIAIRLTFIDGEQTATEHIPISDKALQAAQKAEAESGAMAAVVEKSDRKALAALVETKCSSHRANASGSCKAVLDKHHELIRAEIAAARDSGSFDHSLCPSAASDPINDVQEEKLNLVCRENLAAVKVERALAEAAANIKAKRPKIPNSCRTALDEIEKIDSKWAKTKTADLIKSCYEDLGAIVLRAVTPGAKSCGSAPRDVYDAVEKHEIKSETLKALMVRSDPICAKGPKTAP